jgi:multiple inositol-polyphosphate phosphatase / 2,3-bisphosphoglycerate 3-phosphatase
MNIIRQLRIFIPAVIIVCFLAAFHSDSNNIPWGTKTLYQPLQAVYSKQPKGYEPVFINYVGRHGARHISGIDEDSIMFLVLKKAKQENALTEAGRKLMKMDSLLLIVEKGNIGLISGIGKHEQQGLGERMAKNFPDVFNSGNIRISTTKKERTKQSARAFMKGLKPVKSIVVDTVFNDQDHLAFYDVAPAYKLYEDNNSWKALWSKVQNSAEVVKLEQELPKRFFSPAFIGKMNSGQIDFQSDKGTIKYNSGSFIEGFYGGCSIIPSIKEEIEKAGYQPEDIDFSSLVSHHDLVVLDYVNTAEDFLMKGPATDSNGIQVKISAPLLLDFLNSTNQYISTKKTIANLRFAHAETISPFAVLLGITGASEATSPDRITDFNKAWKCEKIIPLSANIQMILYKSETKADFLVKFLLNEKEVTINGLKDCGTPFYYQWNEVNDFYTKKLARLNLHQDDDVHDFLLNLK